MSLNTFRFHHIVISPATHTIKSDKQILLFLFTCDSTLSSFDRCWLKFVWEIAHTYTGSSHIGHSIIFLFSINSQIKCTQKLIESIRLNRIIKYIYRTNANRWNRNRTWTYLILQIYYDSKQNDSLFPDTAFEWNCNDCTSGGSQQTEMYKPRQMKQFQIFYLFNDSDKPHWSTYICCFERDFSRC